jgi:predicted dehydrogenase
MSIRVGLVGTNTSHAGVFAGLLNSEDGEQPRVGGGRVVGVWGSGRAGLSGPHPNAAELARQFGIDRVVDQPGDLVGSVDVALIVDDVDGGALHAELARPFLQAGVPTFIDKPMTLDIADAVALFDLAEQHGAPLMSASALRFAAELEAVTGVADKVGQLSSVISVGPGDWYNYGVHAVEVAQAVAGAGASWVHQFAAESRDVTVVGFEAGPSVVVETLRDAAYVFHVVAYGDEGFAQAQIVDFSGFYAGTMAAVLEMARTGVAPVGRADTLEVLAILAAGQRSAESGGPVRITDVLPGGAA